MAKTICKPCDPKKITVQVGKRTFEWKTPKKSKKIKYRRRRRRKRKRKRRRRRMSKNLNSAIHIGRTKTHQKLVERLACGVLDVKEINYIKNILKVKKLTYQNQEECKKLRKLIGRDKTRAAFYPFMFFVLGMDEIDKFVRVARQLPNMAHKTVKEVYCGNKAQCIDRSHFFLTGNPLKETSMDVLLREIQKFDFYNIFTILVPNRLCGGASTLSNQERNWLNEMQARFMQSSLYRFLVCQYARVFFQTPPPKPIPATSFTKQLTTTAPNIEDMTPPFKKPTTTVTPPQSVTIPPPSATPSESTTDGKTQELPPTLVDLSSSVPKKVVVADDTPSLPGKKRSWEQVLLDNGYIDYDTYYDENGVQKSIKKQVKRIPDVDTDEWKALMRQTRG